MTCGGTVTRTAPAPAGVPTTVPSGSPLPTDPAGTYVLTVTATVAGHSASLTRTYTVDPPSVKGKILFMNAATNRIFTINPDGTGRTQLTGNAGLDPGTFLDSQPTRSPDGQKVIFARRTTPAGPSQLWVIDADGRNPRQLTTNAGDHTAPAWSPDGGSVAFELSGAAPKGIEIWVARWNAALSDPWFPSPVNVSNANGDDKTPAWSPDSAKLAFASNRSGQFEIFTMTSTGATQKALTNDKRVDIEPAWSPDGSKLTFSSNRATVGTANGQEVYVMGSANGNSQARLTTISGDDVAPFYFDANRIVFASATVGGGGLAIVAPTGGTVTKVATTAVGDSTPG